MRVDNVPLSLRPAFHMFGYGAGALLHAVMIAIRHTCRLERVRPAAVEGPRIDCFWHEHLPAYIASYLPPEASLRYVWMNHPMWYMRPVHVLLHCNGVAALALGSSGHSGQRALQDVVAYLKNGFSTALAVDGPAGPAHVLKRGALDMALASGCPVVGIRFEYERTVRTPSWDRKPYPLPFSTVRIIESEPLYVTSANYSEQRIALQQAL